VTEKLLRDIQDSYLRLQQRIMSFTRGILEAVTIDEIARFMENHIKEILDYDSIGFVVHKDREEDYRYTNGNKEYVLAFLEKKDSKDLIKWTLSNHKVSAFDIEKDKCVIILPLLRPRRELGFTVLFVSKKASDLTSEDFDLLSFSSLQCSILLESTLMYETLERSEREVRALKDYFQTILNTLNVMIMVFSEEKKVRFANASASHNFNLRDKVEIDNILSQPLSKEANDLIDKTSLTGKFESKEVEIPSHNNTSVLWDLKCLPLKSEEGNEYLLVLEDITNTKELERLKKLDRIKSNFLSSISHELRTPLASIKAYVETLSDSVGELDSDTEKEFLATVYKESEHLEGLLNELLDFSSIERGEFKIKKEEIDLISVLKEVVTLFEEKANREGISLITEFEDTSLRMLADPRRIKQVFTNLISNGIKYARRTDEKKFVKVIEKTMSEKVLIVVEDNGIGIPAEELPRIFERFFRGNEYAYATEGSGLGLSIVKTIVESHGGKIRVESTKGKGSSFYVDLPLISGSSSNNIAT